ncbi:MAG: hypothetical protein EB051_01320 [Chlamydiia bacterium]|nr:hypothetical protein [Chlamydiia bacterium]
MNTTSLNHYFTQIRANLPHDIIPVCGQSFLLTGTMTLLSGKTLSVSLIAGSLAIAATLVESAVRYIFNKSFPNFGFDKKNYTTWTLAGVATEAWVTKPLEKLTGALCSPAPALTLLGIFFIAVYDSKDRSSTGAENPILSTTGAQAFCM